MMQVRKAGDRGYAELDWLRSWHSFSFADYYDPEHVSFGPLRVINEDFIAPGRGFGTHPHRDMEIITYLLEGELEHRDSMGNGSVIRPGEVQRMSAGTGILHSEVNPSPDRECHLLQIWILPDRAGHEPGYEQQAFDADLLRGRLCLLASPDGREGSVTIHQDTNLHTATLDGDEQIDFDLASGRLAWLQVARGALTVNGHRLEQGDGLAVSDAQSLRLEQGDGAEVLLFDMAGDA